MKVFIDTNVALDTMVPGHASEKASCVILSIGGTLDMCICLSVQSLADIACVIRKLATPAGTRDRLRVLIDKCKVLSMSDQVIYKALRNGSPDFEDALQVECADLECCDCIVTNNKDHFEDYTILPVFTPEEFLSHIDAE